MRLPSRPRPARGLRARRPPLTVEVLEGRTLPAGNLFLTAEVPGIGAWNFRQYDQAGDLLSSQPVPPAPGSTEYPDARGLSVDPSGGVNIYDGTFTPALATLAADGQTWSFQSYPGWSTVNNVSYGEVAAYNNFVFASDMATYGDAQQPANGIVRFDSSGGDPVRFGQGTDYIQLALGQDGLLYGLSYGGQVHVFNPDTLDSVRTFSLQGGPDGDIRSIAVDPSGQVVAATWGGYLAEYDGNGNYLTSTQLKDQNGFGENLDNVALDTDGQVAVGARFGDVFLTDESLASVQTVATGQWNVFVTFDHYIGSGQQAATSFDSLAGPTVPFGQPTVTLGGHISGGASVPSGSVSITVAGQTQLAPINPADGTFSAAFDTSALDVPGSPYTITYSYPGDGTHAAAQDSSQSLTVTPAVTSLGSLSSPTVPVGTPQVTASGVLSSNSVLPVGQAITVTAVGPGGAVASGSGTVGDDGSFAATLDTSAVPAGSYKLEYAYAGDANFTPSDGFGSLTVV